MRDSSVVRRYSSGVTGRVTPLTAEGSSRSFRYKPVSLGGGALRLASRKPVGTGAVCVNCGSDATESIKYKLLPLSWHGLSGVAGERNPLSRPRNLPREIAEDRTPRRRRLSAAQESQRGFRNHEARDSRQQS